MGLRGTFVGEAGTIKPWPLVVGRCGVPYVLLREQGNMGQVPVRGELWRVDDETLSGLDEYEGLTKRYYGRIQVHCRISEIAYTSAKRAPGVVQAMMYGVLTTENLWSEDELPLLQCVPEYTQETHKELYRPVEHILLKQQLYLANSKRYNEMDVHSVPKMS